MEIYQLRAFVAVAETGHLTRAAERLHLSQPAASAQIKALEDELGLRLFERTSGGMVLTGAGKRLLDQTARVLAAVEAMRQSAEALRGKVTGRMRIGTLGDPEYIRVGEFLSRAVERFPLIELDLHGVISGVALEQVKDGTLDAGFYYGARPDAGVASIALREMIYCVAAPAAWADRVSGADWNAIAALPWILTPPISTHHHMVRALFREHGVEPSRIVVADQESVIVNLLVSGVGISLLREDLARRMEKAGEVAIWDGVRASTTVWFIYLAEREHDPLVEAMVQVLRETWQLPPQQPPRQPARPAAAPAGRGASRRRTRAG